MVPTIEAPKPFAEVAVIFALMLGIHVLPLHPGPGEYKQFDINDHFSLMLHCMVKWTKEEGSRSSQCIILLHNPVGRYAPIEVDLGVQTMEPGDHIFC